MRPHPLLAAVGAAALALAGCESAAGPPVGASVQALETGRARVVYRGAPAMSEAEVQDRALLRAAELALGQGYAWFTVAARSEVPAPAGPQFSIGVGGASFGRGGGVGAGGVGSFGGGRALIVTLEIVGGRGPRPSSPDVYDAQDVASTLGARLR